MKILKEIELFFEKTDFDNFRIWLNLNLDDITWQGKFREEFEDFWNYLFLEGLSTRQIVARLNYACKEVTLGPVSSWLSWVRGKFLSYIFINKDLSIYQIAKESEMGPSDLAGVLRSFFLDYYPEKSDSLCTYFQIGNVASKNINLKFETLSRELGLSKQKFGGHKDEIMPSMEITLYEEWSIFVSKMKRDLLGPEVNYTKLEKKASLKTLAYFLRDFLVLFISAWLLIALVYKANEFWEKKIAGEISVYEPQFNWPNRLRDYLRENKKIVGKEQLPPRDFREMEKNTANQELENIRYETESEAVFTSWEEVPKNFEKALNEQSSYEEEALEGYRAVSYGNTKVYRVILKSVDLPNARKKINEIVKNFKASRADHVKPGQIVPGGAYYNVYVPSKNLKIFLSEVMKVNQSNLYENQIYTRHRRFGQSRVFIMIQSI